VALLAGVDARVPVSDTCIHKSCESGGILTKNQV